MGKSYAYTRGGLAGALKGRTVVRRCGKCGLGFPRYPGRYPSTCPQCKGDICPVEESMETVITCVSMVPRIQRVLDAAAPAAAPDPRSSRSFIVRYDEMDRMVPGGVQALQTFMEGPSSTGNVYFRVEDPRQPVLVMELDDKLRRARLFASEDPAAYLGYDPRKEFVDTDPVFEVRGYAQGWDRGADSVIASYYFPGTTDRGVVWDLRRKAVRIKGVAEASVFNTGSLGPTSATRKLQKAGLLPPGDAWYIKVALVRDAQREVQALLVGAGGVPDPANVQESLSESGGAPSSVSALAGQHAYLASTIPVGDSSAPTRAVELAMQATTEDRAKSNGAYYGGFHFTVGTNRNRKPRMNMRRVVQNKRNARRGVAKRTKASKDWHRSSEGKAMHRALRQYNSGPLGSGRRNGASEAVMEGLSPQDIYSRALEAVRRAKTQGPRAMNRLLLAWDSAFGLDHSVLPGGFGGSSPQDFARAVAQYGFTDPAQFDPQAGFVVEALMAWRPNQHLLEAASDYRETIDDVLDNILRKLLVMESLDILQDVEFDEATGSIYLFFDPSLELDEVGELAQVLRMEYRDTLLVGAPPGAPLPATEAVAADADWWVMFIPRPLQDGMMPQPDLRVFTDAQQQPPGPPKKQQIVVQAPVSQPEQMADQIDVDSLLGDFAQPTAEALRRLPANIQERIAARLAATAEGLIGDRQPYDREERVLKRRAESISGILGDAFDVMWGPLSVHIWRAGSYPGDFYKGRYVRVEPGRGIIYVDGGREKHVTGRFSSERAAEVAREML